MQIKMLLMTETEDIGTVIITLYTFKPRETDMPAK